MTILLNPKKHDRYYPDENSKEIMLKTIDFFEKKGKAKLKEDYHERVWYSDFIEFQKNNKIFAQLLTPTPYGTDENYRWDTYRICEFNEILAFYGLNYWYTWQVSILGLGPIWMSKNEIMKKKAAQLLNEGAIFAFGLSEKAHGADIYGTEMKLTLQEDETYRANGEKYYIGNGNEAEMVSNFGKLADIEGNIPPYDMKNKEQYVFFVANYKHKNYELKKNVCDSQNYVANFALHDYPITEDEILSKGEDAWNASLNTVNIGKYNLGWASIGICTHAFYEAIHHAAYRRLYNMYVTDFQHVKQNFVDAYTRLVAMKLFGLRTADYMRVASKKDRRYLLYAPVMKMKTTTQGEEVINLLWDVIAAKGFEKDMYFENAATDIRALPKLEGTVHVNIALILKFMLSFFMNHKNYEEVSQQSNIKNDDFLFNQGPARGLGRVRLHDWKPAFEKYPLPNVKIFLEQIKLFNLFGTKATPSAEQQKDMDFMLSGIGQIFALIVYAHLIIENAPIYNIDDDTIDQIFDFLVRDFSKFALNLYHKPSTTTEQMEWCLKMIKKPNVDQERFNKVWNIVHDLKDAYQMND
ncbi:MAG TPA: acyl-CoA dehydrogenase family protein [Candidatus Glassbacteria bacterium]|nr:acyl-CoA dehydrogenase family protein [Candidatus Glassbacteria bacterium]